MGKLYTMGKRVNYVVQIALIAALGGLLFGFDTAVISGAEKSIQDVFKLDGFWHGFTVAIALIGTVIGAVSAGKPADVFGRKRLLIFIAALYTLSALGSALATNWYAFLTFRFIGGVGVGASSVLGPMYIAEIAPPHLRGRLVSLFQFNVVFGILLAFFSNYLISTIAEANAWRWMLGVESIPALLFFVLLFRIPPTPRWLVFEGYHEEARRMLEKLSSKDPDQELKDIQETLHFEQKKHAEPLFRKKYLIPIMLAFLVAFFNQMSGINAIMYYAPRIFELAGFASDAALLQSVMIGFTNLIFTMIGMSVIDKFGRKKLLLAGSVGMIVFLGLTSHTLLGASQGSPLMVGYLIGFIGFFAFSQGAVIWVYISEVFPNKVRAKGQTLGSFTHWFMAAVVSWGFPVIVEGSRNGGGIAFAVFAVMMVVQLLVVAWGFPETKGKSLEQIEHDLLRE